MILEFLDYSTAQLQNYSKTSERQNGSFCYVVTRPEGVGR